MIEPTALPTGRRLGIRFALVAVALALVWLMEGALIIVREQVVSGFPWTTWLSFLAFGVLAGLSFGAAALLPARWEVRHPRRALALGAIPGAIIVFGALTIPYPALASWDIVSRLAITGGVVMQPVCAVLLGVAISTAFAER